jgi:hypothetical protein
VPQWKFPYDRDGVPSLDMRVQTRRGSQIELSGTVDSGASSTVLSLEHADELGFAPTDLRTDSEAVIADGSKVRCWTTSTPIRAQVLRPSPDGELHPWGPVFAVRPVFLEHASPLWGQADFFAVFGVMFWRNIAPPQFELSY